MATSQVSEVIQHLRRAVLLREGAGLTDGQLLKDYLGRRDEAALAALVRRHGPMVWGVCRRVLRNYHDAEDAFQATFLVLVRRAASIASPELLANWLYGVAHQTALNARATTAKRRAGGRQVTEMPEPAVTERDLLGDLQPLLDQELSRLPDKYRVAIVLCDLEGKTRKEVARQLGVPDGTLAARLARGRVMLAKRLAQRGVALSGGALAAVLSQNVASAVVPTSVVSSTIKAASLFAAGHAATRVLSTKVTALTEGVLKAMLVSKLKYATAVLLVFLTCVGGGTVAMLQTAAGQSQPAQKPEVKADLSPAPKDQDAKREPAAKPDLQERKDKLFTHYIIYEVLTVGGHRGLALQKELQISPDQAKAMSESWALIIDRRKGLPQITDEDKQKYIDEAEKGLRDLKKEYSRILTPEQLKRLEQIGMQCRFFLQARYFAPQSPGAGGLSFPDVQKALNVTDKQKEQVKEIDAEAGKEWVGLKGHLMMNGDITREQVRIHKAALEKAVKVLTEAQRKAWQEMVGGPWDIEEWDK